ncbi:MAG: hypothetical protein H7061_06575 [Bdellovibrionaceae bacterium]|nr:hypothetical protein [Bdellovibrio sp.]
MKKFLIAFAVLANFGCSHNSDPNEVATENPQAPMTSLKCRDLVTEVAQLDGQSLKHVTLQLVLLFTKNNLDLLATQSCLDTHLTMNCSADCSIHKNEKE